MPSSGTDLTALLTLQGVPSALAAARDGVDALLRDRGLRRTTPELTAESLLRGAAASGTLDGSTTDLEDLRGGAADLVAMRAARLNASLLALVPVVGKAPLQALARLHVLAATGAAPEASLGRPRPESSVAPRLQVLARLLTTQGEAPAVGVAALAHAEVVALAPFESDNGLVGRALERLVLVARGVDPTSMTVPEAGHLASGVAYGEALATYRSGGQEGALAWLLYAATALGKAAEASPLNDRET